MTRRQMFTPEQDKLILQADTLGYTHILQHIQNRTRDSLRARKHYLIHQQRIREVQNSERVRLIRKKSVGRAQKITKENAIVSNARWVAEEDNYVLTSKESLETIALKLGRTYRAVRMRITYLRKHAHAC